MDRMHVEVYGRVQGVAFRAHTMRRARELGLCGWVRNRPDGSVEVLAEGELGDLAALRDYCASGPPAAEVRRVEERRLELVGDLGPFSIRYT